MRMMAWIRDPRQVLADRSGVTSMEYAILAFAFVTATAFAVSQLIAPSLGALFANLIPILG
jgi:Flp pilus assembly pilin Flp